MERPLYIMIGCDCDHDRPRFNQQMAPDEIAWKGYSKLWENFNRIRETVAKQTGHSPVLTAHVRADEQVYAAEGSHDFCFRHYRKHLASQADERDELSWHNHQWRLSEGKWIQELDDDAWMVNNIEDSYESILPFAPTTLHTGWCYQNTATMNAYNDVGVQLDTSALPGSANLHGETSRFDYRQCDPQKIYSPCRSDYQQAGTSGENSLVEIPTSTVGSTWIRFASIMNNLMVGRFCPKTFSLRKSFTQINVRGQLFRPYLRSFFREHPNADFFSSYFHADELLSDENKSRKARNLYKCDYFAENLIYLIELAHAHQREVKFCSFRQFARESMECEREHRRVSA